MRCAISGDVYYKPHMPRVPKMGSLGVDVMAMKDQVAESSGDVDDDEVENESSETMTDVCSPKSLAQKWNQLH
eukprot:1863982-Amphidinium_carterae.1